MKRIIDIINFISVSSSQFLTIKIIRKIVPSRLTVTITVLITTLVDMLRTVFLPLVVLIMVFLSAFTIFMVAKGKLNYFIITSSV